MVRRTGDWPQAEEGEALKCSSGGEVMQMGDEEEEY